MPMYAVQLNAYALIAEHLHLGSVSKLALVYTEPMTGERTASKPEIHTDDGFMMPFSITIHPVSLNPEKIHTLLQKAREIYILSEVPVGKPGCKDCRKLDRIIHLTHS